LQQIPPERQSLKSVFSGVGKQVRSGGLQYLADYSHILIYTQFLGAGGAEIFSGFLGYPAGENRD
jgi:hypothetical protein